MGLSCCSGEFTDEQFFDGLSVAGVCGDMEIDDLADFDFERLDELIANSREFSVAFGLADVECECLDGFSVQDA